MNKLGYLIPTLYTNKNHTNPTNLSALQIWLPFGQQNSPSEQIFLDFVRICLIF